MNEVAAAIELARTEFASAAPDFMPDLCDIYGPGTESHDSYGDLSTSSTAVYEEVPCEFSGLFGYERASLGISPSIAMLYLEVPATYTIQADYRVVIRARGSQPEITFQVIAPLKSSNELTTRVAVTEQG